MTLGEKIYRLRTEQGLSQEAFGEKLGVSRQSVSKWETDQSVPELDKIVAISDYFGISTDRLLKESEDIYGTTDETYAVGETEASSEDSLLRVEYRFGQKRRFEYRSKKMIGSLPLVHISSRRAKGVIAIGAVAEGWLAVGFAAFGGVSIGIVSLGLFALATFAVGLAAFGSFSVGVISFGAVTFGIFSVGALTFGQFAFGASAHGAQVAVGDAATGGKIALGYSRAVGSYTQISHRKPFDCEEACRMIDAYVSPHWGFFKTWAKSVVRWF
ncbi:MAG: helix-turn-helix domain-containing protein [Bacteroidales bacterium]|nr:helix-turn-helix domain-containing protein [Bacteroidales bacterium]MCM1416616.1 helix-turn-helix domain-containing protein [bacterium]MCM1424321.1 helix-turn-helix domain-containing protein [bacterium]